MNQRCLRTLLLCFILTLPRKLYASEASPVHFIDVGREILPSLVFLSQVMLIDGGTGMPEVVGHLRDQGVTEIHHP